jgi:hypothetical protein
LIEFIFTKSDRVKTNGFDLISEALPFGRLWYQDANAAVGYAQIYSRSHRDEVRVFDAAGAVLTTESWAGDFKEM